MEVEGAFSDAQQIVLHNNLNASGRASALAAFFLPVAFRMVVKVGPEWEGRSRLPPLNFIVTPYAAYAAHLTL